MNGRTDCHVWVDAGYALAFEVMAGRAARAGDAWLAGQFRRAAALAFQNLARWRREDGEWAGSYFITKNHFDPRLRVGYQQASQYSNYSGSLMFHLAELVRARRAEIAEKPAPAEIGGYAIELDPEFSSVLANAGGFQMQANLRGQTAETHGNRWTPLGVVRLGRPGWDTRLGPSDGALTASGGVSFAPEFLEGGRWLRLAGLTERYEATWKVALVHPMLVRCALDYRPKPGSGGPTFRHEFTLTPDGLYAVLTKTSGAPGPWGVTLPLLENDGRPLRVNSVGTIASTRYPSSGDEQNFLALNNGVSMEGGRALRGSYGDLRPVRFTAPGRELRVFVYPRTQADPSAEDVRDGFVVTREGFTSPLGRLKGNVYAGRTSAGGVGLGVDLKGNGKPDVSFSQTCGFLAQVHNGRITAVEVDRPVRATVHGRHYTLKAYTPVQIGST